MDDHQEPYFIIVTRGHQYDVDCMHVILGKRHSYIGMMGSKVRVKNLKAGLLEEGYDAVLLDSVHMPIGLKIGAMTPEEIAVSIIAEVIECRRTRKRSIAILLRCNRCCLNLRKGSGWHWPPSSSKRAAGQEKLGQR
ncbi:MAG: XdhC family protein [Lachnospiraceae bacterium]